MAVDIIARGMAGNGGSGSVDQSYVDAQDRKTLNDAKSYTNETAIDYIGREQQIDFNATLEGNIITATLDETVSDFTFTNNTGYLFHIYLPLVTLTGTLDNSYEIILKDKDNNTININCMFQKDITKTSTVGDLCQIQDYDTGIGYSWEFYGNYREITENGTLIREVYTDTVVRETNPSMNGQDLHLAIVNSKLKVGTVVMCTTNYENNGSAYYAGRTYKINGDYSTGELILSAEDITVNTFGTISVENVVSKNLLTLGYSVKTSNGLTTIAGGSSITINGTTTLNWADLNESIEGFDIEAGDYTFSVQSNLKAIYVIYFKYEDGTEYHVGLDTNLANSLKITFAQKVHSIRMVIDGLTSGTTISNEVVNFQLEKGSTATPYTPYLNMQELEKNSIINNYSTGEQVIGKWIDGKPLYRKVITSIHNGGETLDHINISGLNIYRCPTLEAKFYPGENETVPSQLTNDSGYYFRAYIGANKTTLTFEVSKFYASGAIETILEYTKTTD